jgi:hypothetical protein
LLRKNFVATDAQKHSLKKRLTAFSATPHLPKANIFVPLRFSSYHLFSETETIPLLLKNYLFSNYFQCSIFAHLPICPFAYLHIALPRYFYRFQNISYQLIWRYTFHFFLRCKHDTVAQYMRCHFLHIFWYYKISAL